MVCLPGFLGDARIFEPLGPLLAARRGAMAFDLPPGGPAEAAAALAPALEAVGRPVHLLTGSFGGLVARSLPPALLASLAMVATLPDPALIPPGVRAQAALLTLAPAPLIPAIYRRHLRRALAADGVPRDLALRLVARGLDKATLLGRLRGVLRWETGPLPPCPILWVRGATDPQAPPVEALPDVAEVTHVPGGHRPYASHPGPLFTRLERFWGEVSSSSTRSSSGGAGRPRTP